MLTKFAFRSTDVASETGPTWGAEQRLFQMDTLKLRSGEDEIGGYFGPDSGTEVQEANEMLALFYSFNSLNSSVMLNTFLSCVEGTRIQPLVNIFSK